MAKITNIQFGGLSNSLDQSVEGIGTAWTSNNCTTDKGILEGIHRYKNVGARPDAKGGDTGYGLGYGKYAGNAVQVLKTVGGPTGGTFVLQFDGPANAPELNEDLATLNYNCTASQVYDALQACASIAPDDVIVTGGPFPAVPITVQFSGQYAQQNMRLLELKTNSLTGGSTPSVTIEETVRGGEFEIFYAVVRHEGDLDANLYAITSIDNFETTTWTSLATDFHASPWYFTQYQDKVFMANRNQGLKYITIGTPTLSAPPPAGPTQPPTYSLLQGGLPPIPLWDATYTITGLSGTVTVAPAGNGVLISIGSAQSNKDVVLTVTLNSNKDYSFNDAWALNVAAGGTASCRIDFSTLKVEVIDSASNVSAPAITNIVGYPPQVGLVFSAHFSSQDRVIRKDTKKIRISFRVDDAAANSGTYFFAYEGRSYVNDTNIKFNENNPLLAAPTVDKIEYAYSYYDTTTGAESSLSPTLKTAEIPSVPNAPGVWTVLTGSPSTALTSSDRVFFYRKEKGTNEWRRLPNVADWQQVDDFGDQNNPPSLPTLTDGWMESELRAFPTPNNGQTGFPPSTTGVKADGLAVWKGSLVVLSEKLAFISWVGQPLRFEDIPAPNKIGLDPEEYPDVGVTEYVSDNRAEDVYVAVGQDSLYAVTALSSYAKVGDSPGFSSVFRRMPGSRGTLGRRSTTLYGGGILNAAKDGLWYYSVGRGFSGEDNGALVERLETKEIETSYQRLISNLYKLTVNATGGTYKLQYGLAETAAIPFDATAEELAQYLLGMSTLTEVEVFGGPLEKDGGLNPSSTPYYIRLLGGEAATNAGAILVGGANLTGTATAETITQGGGELLSMVEYNDEYWLFSGRNFLHKSKNGRWVEGYLNDSVVVALSNRSLGLFFLSGQGKLMKFKQGQYTDAGVPVKWQYETPWMTGLRGRIENVTAVCAGTPTLRIISDDIDNGLHAVGVTLSSNKSYTFNSANLPGIKHKLVLEGVVGRDEVHDLQLKVSSLGDGAGS